MYASAFAPPWATLLRPRRPLVWAARWLVLDVAQQVEQVHAETFRGVWDLPLRRRPLVPKFWRQNTAELFAGNYGTGTFQLFVKMLRGGFFGRFF